MKFVNREKELEELERIFSLSKKKLFPIVLFGARRIGKTRLVREFSENKKSLYFFIYDNKNLNSLLKEFEKELKEKNIIDQNRTIVSMEEFMDIIFERCGGYVLIFDEVQHMLNIYKPFFSIMQKKIDENNDCCSMIIFLGSVIGLVKRVFENLKAPLYGRIKQEILLKALKYKDIRTFLQNLKYAKEEDFVNFYGIFGGIPKYYVVMEDYELNNLSLIKTLKFLFFRENAPLTNEITNMLRQEFGKSKGYYYEILEAIATGHTKLNQIATYVGKHQTEITSFMKDLMDYYELIKRETRITDNPLKSRNSIYLIRNPLVKFWFRFIYPNLKYVELNSFEYIIRKVNENINSHIGYGFEEACKEFIPEKYSLIGKWWGHYRKNGKRKEIEIDIVALNEDRKEILFIECKWKEKVNAEKILQELKEKSKFVQWNNDKRKESYAIFAKSFKKKIKEKGLHLFDLKDLKKSLALKYQKL